MFAAKCLPYAMSIAMLCLPGGSAIAQSAASPSWSGSMSGIGSTPSSGGLPIGGTSPSTGAPWALPNRDSSVGPPLEPLLPTSNALRPTEAPPGSLRDPRIDRHLDDPTVTDGLPLPVVLPRTPPTFPVPGERRDSAEDLIRKFQDPSAMP